MERWRERVWSAIDGLLGHRKLLIEDDDNEKDADKLQSRPLSYSTDNTVIVFASENKERVVPFEFRQ